MAQQKCIDYLRNLPGLLRGGVRQSSILPVISSCPYETDNKRLPFGSLRSHDSKPVFLYKPVVIMIQNRSFCISPLSVCPPGKDCILKLDSQIAGLSIDLFVNRRNSVKECVAFFIGKFVDLNIILFKMLDCSIIEFV